MKVWIISLFGFLLALFRDISSAPCKLFPKIFGGSSASTYFINFDVHYASDMIAVGGKTMEQSLLPFLVTVAPIIILYSISNTTINWAVTDDSKPLY
jgi:hypothetical protein